MWTRASSASQGTYRLAATSPCRRIVPGRRRRDVDDVGFAPGLGTQRHRPSLPSRSVELLIVIVIVLILLFLAVPSYLGFVSRANTSAARANVRSAIPAVEAYFLLHDGSYAGLDLSWLETFDPGVELNDPARLPRSRR